MKIAVLTLPLSTNYGGILQAYALQIALQRMGHEVVVVDLDQTLQRGFWVQAKEYVKYAVKRYLLWRDVFFMSDRQRNLEREEREQHTRSFINRYISTFSVRNLPHDFPIDVDAVIVGSDQVWRKHYFCDIYGCGIENAFLSFTEGRDMKRLAYAASFGTDTWDYSNEETSECARFLKYFDAVSVREKSGVQICCERLNRTDALHVVDPTMLLDKNDYVRLVEQSDVNKSPGNMMCYILDATEDTRRVVAQMARERGLTPFYANSKTEDFKAPRQERIQPPVEQWLRGFIDAELVVTDSFHACVFSIIFGKPFVVLDNNARGVARIQSLQEMIDMDRLEPCRQASLAFLRDSLK